MVKYFDIKPLEFKQTSQYIVGIQQSELKKIKETQKSS